MLVHLILEGHLEEPVADKLLCYCGHQKGTVYGKQGFGYIQTKASAFQTLARYGNGVLALTDLRDSGEPCPGAALAKYRITSPPQTFLCRFAVAELESWFLADREAVANFFGISLSAIPFQPDTLVFPKRELVNLARRSRKKSIREGIVPEPSHGGAVAPAYLSTMTEFVRGHWDIKAAMATSPSLKHCVERLKNLS